MSEQRLTRIEQEVDELYKANKALEQTIHQLNVTIALLQQTLQEVKVEQENKAQFSQKISFFFFGGLISAVVAFVVRGGLAP